MSKDNVIDFQKYKQKKEEKNYNPEDPIVDHLSKLTFGDPDNLDTQVEYLCICNLVHNGRQFLALDRLDAEESEPYVIVEAIVEDGVMQGVQMVEEQEYPEIESLFTEIIKEQKEKQDHEELLELLEGFEIPDDEEDKNDND